MKALHATAFILVIIGSINWLLIGLFNWSIQSILGGPVSKVVFILVGLSAIYLVISHKKDCTHCMTSSSSSMPDSTM